ncbi:MAG: stalk domain-containing protein [Tepidanaerobacteraceae bacterium]|jgi:spore germination protein
MKRKVKLFNKIILFTLVAMFVMVTPASSTYALTQDIKVVLNGQKIEFDVKPILINNRTMVPFRKIGEALGAAVHWEQDTRTIKAYKGSTSVTLKVGSPTAYIDRNPVKLDVSPVIRDGRTLVPLRFFGEAFGAKVAWRQDTRTVVIDTGEKISKHIMGYYYSQSYDDFLNNYDKLSSIAPKWYTLDQYGDVTDNDTSRWIMTPQGYEDVLKLARQQEIKVHMLVFENSAEKLGKVMATNESRSRLVNQIITIVDREGYDGVNIDFEYLRASDRDRFNQFIELLSKNLHSKGKSLSISLPVKTEKTDWWPGYDYETLGKHSDLVVLMAYDKNPASPEPQAGINWVEEIVDYTVARIPAQKIVLGIGYYGYDWYDGGRNTILPAKNSMTYGGIVFADELVAKRGLRLNIDEKTGMLYGTYTDENGTHHQVWMESDYLVDLKAKLVIRKGLKGIALWRLGYSTPGFWKAVENNFIRTR